MADWLKDFMGRTPFAILGAIGLLSMASQFINLADDIENWLKVWKAVTRPVWEWIAGLIGYELPNWLKDYLTVGVIHTGMMFRAIPAFDGGVSNSPDDGFSFSTKVDVVVSSLTIFLTFILLISWWPMFFLLLTSIFVLHGINLRQEFHQSKKNCGEPHIEQSTQEFRARLMTCVMLYFETTIYVAITLAISGAAVLAE